MDLAAHAGRSGVVIARFIDFTAKAIENVALVVVSLFFGRAWVLLWAWVL